MQPLTRFNSTLIRLGLRANRLLVANKSFQFHFDSTGTNNLNLTNRIGIWFQFHFDSTGTTYHSQARVWDLVSIPLWFDWDPANTHIPTGIDCFNSTLIRLGLKFFCLFDRHFICFNSTLIRLGLVLMNKKQPCYRVSIPLWFDWDLIKKYQPKFNKQVSIPLWFDWDMRGQKWDTNIIWCFNSTLIRLGQGTKLYKRNGEPGFNSTLIRLGH